MRRLTCWLIACLLPLLATAKPVQNHTPPNIVFILADDLGWSDLQSYGSQKYLSPHLDAMASRGMRFTDAYAAGPVCSPTRASIMTGKYPARIHLTDWIGGRDGVRSMRHLRLSEVTIAEALKQAGYATGVVGKWHLGGPEYFPKKQGFDVAIGAPHEGLPRDGYNLPNRPDLPGSEEGEYLTDHLTDAGIEFVEANKDRPFFLYQSYHSVHVPIEGRPDLVAEHEVRARKLGLELNAHYAAMIQSLDAGVGRILSTLDRLGLTERTVVVFFSDNGGFSHLYGEKNDVMSNLPLRMGKGYLYEGGIRAPLIVQYPPLVAAGSVSSEQVISTDFYPTILELLGVDAMPEQHVDGVSIVPLLEDSTASLGRPAIYFHFPHRSLNGGRRASAIRVGDFKLIDFFGRGRLELYNLEEDIGESRNLAETDPAKAEELHSMLIAWRKNVDAQMPARYRRKATRDVGNRSR
jgi:arylsulfatase A-like enzyme